MREPLLAPRLDFVVHAVEAPLPHARPRPRRPRRRVLDAIDLVEHEHRRLAVVDVWGARSVGHLGAVGRNAGPLLGRRNDQGGPGEAHLLAALGGGPGLAGRGPYRTVITRHFH